MQDLAILSFPDDEESDEEAVKKTNKCVLVWEVGNPLLNTKAELLLIPDCLYYSNGMIKLNNDCSLSNLCFFSAFTVKCLTANSSSLYFS